MSFKTKLYGCSVTVTKHEDTATVEVSVPKKAKGEVTRKLFGVAEAEEALREFNVKYSECLSNSGVLHNGESGVYAFSLPPVYKIKDDTPSISILEEPEEKKKPFSRKSKSVSK